MTKESVKIEEAQKERLDELRDNFNYAEPSYSGLIEYLLDFHDGTVDGGSELPDSGASDDSDATAVTRTSAGGDNSAEADENEGLSAEEKAEKFRVGN